MFINTGRGAAVLQNGRGVAEDYTARGMEPFTYESRGKVLTMSYHEVPPEVLEQPTELVEWARRAIKIAGIKLNARKPKKSK